MVGYRDPLEVAVARRNFRLTSAARDARDDLSLVKERLGKAPRADLRKALLDKKRGSEGIVSVTQTSQYLKLQCLKPGCRLSGVSV